MHTAAIERLGERVEALRGRVYGASEFSALMQSRTMNESARGAYVVPMALRGGQARAAAGAFIQDVDELIAVVIVVPATGPRDTRALGTIEDLINAVIAALAGWRPADAPGVLRLVQGRMINVNAGVLVYHLDFAAANQLRIDPR